MVKRGQYAIVDGVEYAAQVNWKRGVSLFIPRTGPKPDGWEMGGGQTWGRVVDAEQVSEAFEVLTTAMLDDVEVYVDSVNPHDRTAVVRAIKPTSINDRSAPPPHPLFHPIDDPPYSIDWVATVPWEHLNNIDEAVGRIDPSTGSRIHDETT